MRTVLVILALAAATVASAKPAPAKPKTVTLDVKDADVRAVLQSLQQQCGIKNLVIDREVSGTATFYFREVPCPTAFRVVLRTYGLAVAK